MILYKKDINGNLFKCGFREENHFFAKHFTAIKN